MKPVTVFGALLMAAPLFSQVSRPPAIDPVINHGTLHWFSLDESRAELDRLLGSPAHIGDFGEDLISLEYQIGVEDKHDFSHHVVVRRSSGKIISVSRDYEPERTVDEWFPDAETRVCWFPDAASRQWGVRVRRLAGGRLLMAMGISKPGQKTGQVVLMRERELAIFYPWAARQLGAQ